MISFSFEFYNTDIFFFWKKFVTDTVLDVRVRVCMEGRCDHYIPFLAAWLKEGPNNNTGNETMQYTDNDDNMFWAKYRCDQSCYFLIPIVYDFTTGLL